jgi:hypothetical protein
VRQAVASAEVLEAPRHHPDHAEWIVGQAEGLADGVRVASHQPFPHVVADDDHVRGAAGGFFLIREAAAQHRLHAEQCEEAVGDADAREALRMVTTVLLILADVRADVLKDAVLASVIEEISRREREFVEAFDRVGLVDANDLRRWRYWHQFQAPAQPRPPQ